MSKENVVDATTNDSGWRSLIYIPATVSEDDGRTIVTPATVRVLDQLLLPHTISYIPIDSIQKGWEVIHNMNIRGAPLIAIVAILSLGIIDLQCHPNTQAELQQIETMNSKSAAGADTGNMEETFDAIQMYIHGKIDYLATSRPTAVNLFNALRDVKELIQSLRSPPPPPTTSTTTTSTDATFRTTTPRQRMVTALVQYAEQMLQSDEADCRAIGDYGAQEILSQHAAAAAANDPEETHTKMTVLTICNTGSLATANYGTALGVVRSIHAKQQLQQVVVLETRPYNQGSRLTAFECLQDALPNPILICDNMITAFIHSYHQENTTTGTDKNTKKNMVIVVGADRVVANGDTANKIGTFQLAVVAQHHGIPLYVAAPTTTCDVQTSCGTEIEIEIRPARELIQSSQAPHDMPVWNPAFDVTPAKYITGIITEKGVIHPKEDGTFDIAGFLSDHSSTSRRDQTSEPNAAVVKEDLSEYTEQTTLSLPSYIAANIPEAMKILNVTTADEMEAVEMGDGNLNLVFIVSNKSSNETHTKIIVKQALPYVRCVGESWPLTLDRAFYEYTALQAQKKACPEYVPNLYHFSKKDALIVMEYLAPPIQILRKGLIAGIRYNTMSYDMGVFCAKTLFRTSGFALSTTELRQRVEFWSTNSMMCALTEQVVFTEPYIVASNNNWTSPYLDDDKKAIETNTLLKLAASQWKRKFVTQTEALIHADLHTGSVMCANDVHHQTYVIDPEFAFYGPAAFDTGAFIANLLLSYVSQKAHRKNDSTNHDYDEWILQQIVVFWKTFMEQFTKYWNDPNEYTGFMYDCMKDMWKENDTILKQCQDEYMQQFLCDTMGFAGMKMLRRIVGIAHVEDLQSITDLELRSVCERRGLQMAQHFIIYCCHGGGSSSSFQSIEDVVAFVRHTK